MESNEGHVGHAASGGFPIIDDTKEFMADMREMMPYMKKGLPIMVRLAVWFEGSWIAKLLGYKKG